MTTFAQPVVRLFDRMSLGLDRRLNHLAIFTRGHIRRCVETMPEQCVDLFRPSGSLTAMPTPIPCLHQPPRLIWWWGGPNQKPHPSAHHQPPSAPSFFTPNMLNPPPIIPLICSIPRLLSIQSSQVMYVGVTYTGNQ